MADGERHGGAPARGWISAEEPWPTQVKNSSFVETEINWGCLGCLPDRDDSGETLGKQLQRSLVREDEDDGGMK